MTTSAADYEIEYGMDDRSRSYTRYFASVKYESGGVVHVGALDPAMRDVLLAEVLGHHITFEKFFAAIARPTETLKYAAEPMNTTYFGGKDGAEESREIARREINRAVIAYARTLGGVFPDSDVDADEDVVVETSDDDES